MNEYYASNENYWHYLGIDADPPEGKIQVLTEAGISIIGYKDTLGMIAWSPLMKRDKAKEELQRIFKGDREALQVAVNKLKALEIPPTAFVKETK